MNNPLSHILVCSDIEKAYEHVQEEYADFRICPFLKEKDDFLLEDAKKVVKEAYIAEMKPKILVLGAKGYRVEAQNSLLKILEEPPRNIVFILIAPTKTVFLPTIRSRMGLQELKIEKEIVHSGLEAVLEHGISFTEAELTHFGRLLELAQLNSRPQNMLFTLLISIMKRKRA